MAENEHSNGPKHAGPEVPESKDIQAGDVTVPVDRSPGRRGEHHLVKGRMNRQVGTTQGGEPLMGVGTPRGLDRNFVADPDLATTQSLPQVEDPGRTMAIPGPVTLTKEGVQHYRRAGVGKGTRRAS